MQEKYGWFTLSSTVPSCNAVQLYSLMCFFSGHEKVWFCKEMLYLLDPLTKILYVVKV